MNYRLGHTTIEDIRFGARTEVRERVLYIDKAEMEALLSEIPRIKKVKVELAHPGESIRIIPVKDVTEPRVKVDGPGVVFPGWVGGVETVGQGQTNILAGVAVVNCGRLVNFQEGIIDMTGPAADYVPYANTLNVVLLIEPEDGLGKHEHEAAERLVGLRAAAYLGETARNIEPDGLEQYELLSLPDKLARYGHLPRVVYVMMVLSQGLMHDTYVYGVDAKGILPTLLEPTELSDGAVISGNCAGPCHKNTTYSYQNNPIVRELMQRDRKELCFLGVILTNESAMLKGKERSSSYTAKIARMLGAEGAIISEDGGGNPETDLMLICRKLEELGIKTVLVTDEYAGRDGGSQGLADVVPEADAIVTNGNGNMLIDLPPMEKVLGYPDVVEIITGGFASSLREDGSMQVEIAALLSSCSEVGLGKLTCRTK